MENWFKKNKDMLIPTAGAIFVVIMLGGIGTLLNSNGDTRNEDPAEEVPKKIEIPAKEKDSSSKNNEQKQVADKPETFYIEPGPGQILEALDGLDPVALDEQSQKFPGLKVMWPLYFFKLEEDENKNTFLYLDVSETGFGITVVCNIDPNRYPQLNDIKSGDLLWVAGEIAGLDASGTGQFHIQTEQIRFGGTKDKPPPAPAVTATPVMQQPVEASPEPEAAVENGQDLSGPEQ